MRKGDKNSPRTSTCEDFLASTIAISGVLCYTVVASDVGVNLKNVGVLSIESSLFHLFHYTFLQTKHQRKGY